MTRPHLPSNTRLAGLLANWYPRHALAGRLTGSLASRAVSHWLTTVGSNVGIALLGAFGGIAAARLLGAEGRGELAAAVAWAGILGTIAQMGLPQAITYSSAREPARIGSIVAASMALLAVQSVAVLVLGWFAVTVLLERSHPMIARVVRIYLFSVPFSMLVTYLSTMAQGLQQFSAFNALRIASAAGYALVLASAVVIRLHRASDVVTLLLLMQVLLALGSLIWFLLRIRPSEWPSWRQAKALLSYGLRSYGGNLSWMANARLDQFAMSAFIGAAELGLYAVAVSYASLLFPLSAAFSMVLFPHAASSERNSAIKQIRRAVKLNLIVTGVVALVLALLGPVALPLVFGEGFRRSILPAVVLLAGSVALGCNYVLSDGLRGLGHPLSPSIAEMAGAGVTLIGLLLLLPRFGISGAAWVSVFSYVVVLIGLCIGFARASGRGGDLDHGSEGLDMHPDLQPGCSSAPDHSSHAGADIR